MPRSPGRQLEPATRRFFESRMAYDFASVRIHSAEEDAQAARSVNARAYTVGQRIVFGQGEYAPGTSMGSRLLAHELAHVVQQREGVCLPSGFGRADDRYERHAEAVAEGVAGTRPMPSLRVPGGAGYTHAAVQRQEGPAGASSEPYAGQAASEGELMCRAVLEASEGRNEHQTEIITQEEVDKIRSGYPEPKVYIEDGKTVTRMEPSRKPMENFTTCVEFSGQTFADAVRRRSKALNRKPKEMHRASRLLTNVRVGYEKEFASRGTIGVNEAAVKRYDEQLGGAEHKGKKTEGVTPRLARKTAKLVQLQAELKALEDSKTGDQGHDKPVDLAIKAKKQDIAGQNQMVRQITVLHDTVERQRQGLLDKIEKLKAKAAQDTENNPALIHAPTPLTSHPRPGEYILLGAGSSQAYGVKAETNVTLTKGAFKHIAVFKKFEPAPEAPIAKPGEHWERWYTVDGGKLTPTSHFIYVCLDDLRIMPGEAKDPWFASKTSLIGWVDMYKLMERFAKDAPPAAP